MQFDTEQVVAHVVSSVIDMNVDDVQCLLKGYTNRILEMCKREQRVLKTLLNPTIKSTSCLFRVDNKFEMRITVPPEMVEGDVPTVARLAIYQRKANDIVGFKDSAVPGPLLFVDETGVSSKQNVKRIRAQISCLLRYLQCI